MSVRSLDNLIPAQGNPDLSVQDVVDIYGQMTQLLGRNQVLSVVSHGEGDLLIGQNNQDDQGRELATLTRVSLLPKVPKRYPVFSVFKPGIVAGSFYHIQTYENSRITRQSPEDACFEYTMGKLERNIWIPTTNLNQYAVEYENGSLVERKKILRRGTPPEQDMFALKMVVAALTLPAIIASKPHLAEVFGSNSSFSNAPIIPGVTTMSSREVRNIYGIYNMLANYVHDWKKEFSSE